MEVLCIGNSFAVDAATYVHQMAKAAGKELNIYVLYIGGCSVKHHYDNYLSGKVEYEFYKNGPRIDLNFYDIFFGIKYKKWDYISFQQVSNFSGDPESFFPELPLLMEGVRKYSDAKFMLHMTWSYATRHGHDKYGSNPLNQEMMDQDIFNSYEEVSKRVNVPYVIPVGKAIKEARKIYGDHLDRDNFHLNEMGRTLASMVWTYFLLGTDIDISGYAPTGYTYDDVTPGVTKEQYEVLMKIAKEVVINNKKHNL